VIFLGGQQATMAREPISKEALEAVLTKSAPQGARCARGETVRHCAA
jgi:hypothetical protein